MKAVLFRTYGSPDVLRYEDVEQPTPGDGEVLVRVRAASVNPLDWHFMRGEPYVMRAMTGLRQPKDARLGFDLAGEVEAVGRGVTRFQPGDAVFGSGSGAFAEFVCAREKELARKPANLTFEQAAAVPVAGLTALQGLRDRGRIQPGRRVLTNAAARDVGMFAVQIAKSFGAELTGISREHWLPGERWRLWVGACAFAFLISSELAEVATIGLYGGPIFVFELGSRPRSEVIPHGHPQTLG